MDDAADSCGVEGVDPEGEAVDSPVDLQSNLLYTWCCELWVVTSELHCGYRQRKSFPLVVVFSLSQGEELSLLLCFQRSQLKWFVPLIRKPSGRMSLELFHVFKSTLGVYPKADPELAIGITWLHLAAGWRRSHYRQIAGLQDGW